MAKTISNHPHFNSFLPYIPPLILQPSSSTLAWPNERIIKSLEALSKGPSQSGVNSGEHLFNTITQLRNELSISLDHPLAQFSGNGYEHFFDGCLAREESVKFFAEVVPVMGSLLLKLPALLESHYGDSEGGFGGEVETSLRLLESQRPGIVLLSQELIAALLTCSFFCLFPSANRAAKGLQGTNFDYLFVNVHNRFQENQKNKIKCLLHYFERVCLCMPMGCVSFERKVLAREHNPPLLTYPTPELWTNSEVPLCRFEVYNSGAIEDHPGGSLEVDFADEYLGGIVLSWGCEQEEIRFLINPELIAGMLFLPIMADNEAIEIVGAERFSNYTGYASTFRYSGDHVDRREADSLGRRITRVLAIDALPNPGTGQYRLESLLREVNKAFCGFLDQSKHQQQEHHNEKGIITGNWGCGVFGGDPEVKTMIQWLAASQASRPFVSYYTFGLNKLRNLDQVCERILLLKWTVGDLWKMLVAYSSKRAIGETKLGFFSWVLPSTE